MIEAALRDSEGHSSCQAQVDVVAFASWDDISVSGYKLGVKMSSQVQHLEADMLSFQLFNLEV